MTPTRSRIDAVSDMAAVALRTAAMVLLCGLSALPARAEGAGDRALAVELRVALGDALRLAEDGLPPAHVAGLEARIAGSLGLLPWLLAREGREAEARALEALGLTSEQAVLAARLAEIVARTPYPLAERADLAQPHPALEEAAAIHETYCAGCHDSAGTGEPDTALPARDLRFMALEEPADIFLARLELGIKGDETIAFRSPVTDRQLLALAALYRAGWED